MDKFLTSSNKTKRKGSWHSAPRSKPTHCPQQCPAAQKTRQPVGSENINLFKAYISTLFSQAKGKKKLRCLYKKYYHFITFHNNTFSNSFQCPQVILTHRQLSNARVVTAIGRGDQNRKLKCLRFLVVLFSCCSLVIFDYLGVCLPVSFIFKTGSFSRWGINLRNMT